MLLSRADHTAWYSLHALHLQVYGSFFGLMAVRILKHLPASVDVLRQTNCHSVDPSLVGELRLFGLLAVARCSCC